MEYIIVISCIFLSIIILKIVLKIDLKKAKSIQENKELEEFTDKFPDNIDIAKEMLSILNNKYVKIEEAKNTQTSLYIVATNKISIADMKNNYARIQTIAHECLHSIQDKTLLLFNFIFSNITIIYLITAIILTVCKVFKNTYLQLFILTLLAFVKVLVRSYLEIDAMTKSRYLAEKYIKLKKILTKEQEEKLLNKYDEINKMGIPFTVFYTFFSAMLGILVYSIVMHI